MPLADAVAETEQIDGDTHAPLPVRYLIDIQWVSYGEEWGTRAQVVVRCDNAISGLVCVKEEN